MGTKTMIKKHISKYTPVDKSKPYIYHFGDYIGTGVNASAVSECGICCDQSNCSGNHYIHVVRYCNTPKELLDALNEITCPDCILSEKLQQWKDVCVLWYELESVREKVIDKYGVHEYLICNSGGGSWNPLNRIEQMNKILEK